jgi:hypothetical protein
VARWAGPLASVVLAGLWTALTTWRPSVTYHLAPLLLAAAWPYVARAVDGRLERPRAWRAAAGGAAVSLSAAAALWATGHLDGPTLWSESGALAESVLAGVLGAGWGLWSATGPHLLTARARHRDPTPRADPPGPRS